MAEKYYRLVTFVVNICPKPLRALFTAKAETDPNCHYTSIRDYLTFRRSDITRIRQIRQDQLDLIYPAFEHVDIEKWDVTLLILLLKELFPNQLQQKERDCLRDITQIRNSLQHIASTEFITDHQFNTAWEGLNDAVANIKQILGSSSLDNIEDEIKSVLLDHMPSIGDVRSSWLKSLYYELLVQNSELANEMSSLKEELQLQHTELAKEVKASKDEATKSSKILTKAAVKKMGRSGVPEKRMKIVDKKIDRMKDKLARSLSEDNDCKEKFKHEISEILQQLTDNHRVIVTGFDNKATYKCALAAIQERKNVRIDQCLEVNNPSDWKRICSEDAQIVLFREPFGVSAYDFHKVEVMCEEFDSMIQATDDDNDDVIDIIIVSNQRLLNEVIRRNEHDMLLPSSTVYIDSTSGKIPDENITPEDTVYKNLLDMSKLLRKAHILRSVDKQVKEEAKRLFLKQSMVVIVGPTNSGKTSLSFDLLSSYDLSNGEENFLVISDPGELKYVKFSMHPVIIINFLDGGKYDHAEARRWYTQLDRLYAAVQGNQIAVITTIDSKLYRRIPERILQHPILQHTVRLHGSSASRSREDSDEDTNDCGVQNEDTGIEVLPTGNNSTVYKKVDEHQLRSVMCVRDYYIADDSLRKTCNITDVAILPSGETLLVDFINKVLLKLDDDYNVISTLVQKLEPYSLCYIGNNTAVLGCDNQMTFVDVGDDMSVIRSVNTTYNCISLTYHSDKLYVIDLLSVYVYSTTGERLKVLYTTEDDNVALFLDIEISHDGSMIYLITNANKLITIDNSGNHLYTLEIPDVDISSLGRKICLDDRGFPIIIGRNKDNNKEKDILQISRDGRRYVGTIFQIEYYDDYYTIQFDSDKRALVIAGRQNKIKVLSFR